MKDADKLDNPTKTLFHAYDIRGIAGEELDCERAMAIARAFGDTVQENDGRFVIGYDARTTSPSLAEAVSLGLRSGGHHVTHIGLSSTPMLYWYGAENGFDGSLMVTASHLPPNYNGFKLCAEDAIPLSADKGLPEVAARIHLPFEFGQICTPIIDHREALEAYVSVMCNYLQGAKSMKLAVDAGNGIGGVDTHRVFEHFNHLHLHEIDFAPDGHFPNRSPNPLATGALIKLSRYVIKHGCAFGLAFDGDADRAVVVDEKGTMVPPDILGGLLATHFLHNHPGATIVYDLRSSRAIPESIESMGGKAIRTRVGHPFVKSVMREHQALFALENSGHYYYEDLHYTDNGLRTLIELVKLLSASDKPLSERLIPLQRYALSGEINLRIQDRKAALAMLEQAYADASIDRLDGLSVDYQNWWLNARCSNTEPLLRLNIGATDQKQLEQRIQQIRLQLEPFQRTGTRP